MLTIYSHIYLLCMNIRIKQWVNPRTNFLTIRLLVWKAEEYQKFIFPCSEYVLSGKLPDNIYHVWILLRHITELILNSRRKGWTGTSLQLLTKLIWFHNILAEEIEGMKSGVITCHNLLHFPDDIKRLVFRI